MSNYTASEPVLESAEQRQERLASALYTASAGRGDAVLQVDFLDSGEAVLRRRSGPRSWQTVTRGSWSFPDLVALQAQGLIRIGERGQLGVQVAVRPELLGAS